MAHYLKHLYSKLKQQLLFTIIFRSYRVFSNVFKKFYFKTKNTRLHVITGNSNLTFLEVRCKDT